VIEVAPIGSTGKTAASVAQAIVCLRGTAVMYIAAAAGLAGAVESILPVGFGP